MSGAILPGNHDGLMFGIYAFNLLDGSNVDSDALKWNRACRRGAGEPDDSKHKTENEAFTKREFIALYIQEHARRAPVEAGLTPPPKKGRHTASWRIARPGCFPLRVSRPNCSMASPMPIPTWRSESSCRARREPTRDTIIIGLDTNQAGALVGTWDTLMGRSPGSMGHVHPDQIAAVTHWVDEAVAQGRHRHFCRPSQLALAGPAVAPRIALADGPARASAGLSFGAHPPRLLGGTPGTGQPAVAGDERQFAVRLAARLPPASVLPTTKQPGDCWSRPTSCPRETCPPSLMPTCWQPGKNRPVQHPALPLQHISRRIGRWSSSNASSRGTLIEWLKHSLARCARAASSRSTPMPKAYQDELLQLLIQVESATLGAQAISCMNSSCRTGAAARISSPAPMALLAEQTDGFQASIDLFRRKATLVSVFNEHLDELTAIAPKPT